MPVDSQCSIGIEDYWSDLVHELPQIPMGANEYFFSTLKPALGWFRHEAIQALVVIVLRQHHN